MANQDNQGNRDREGNLGQPGGADNPTGTSGRQDGNTGNDNWKQGDAADVRRRKQNNDDDEPGLGNRNTFR